LLLKLFQKLPELRKSKRRRLADARNATCRKVAEVLFRELAKVFAAHDICDGEEGE
jgi:hypothetical protein